MSANRKHKAAALQYFVKDYSSGDIFTYDTYVDWCGRKGVTEFTKMEFAHWLRRVVRAQASLGWNGWLTPYARVESWVGKEKIWSKNLTHLEESGHYDEVLYLGMREYTVYRIASRPRIGTKEWQKWKNSTL